MTNPQKVIKGVIPTKTDIRKRPSLQDGADLRKKQGNGRKAVTDRKLPSLPWWKKLLELPRWVLIFSGVAIASVILIIVFFFPGSPQKEAPTKVAQEATDLSTSPAGGGFLERPLEQPASPQKATSPEVEERPTIQSIRLYPPQATRIDTLKAEVVAAANADPKRVTYTYAWKVNNLIIKGATGETLDLSAFKKRDLVTVTVTPYEVDKAGFLVESPVIAIHGIPPSLDLQAPLKKTKVGAPLELQLVSIHPDSDTITFSLEAPLLPGMSIDGQTGKITWLVPPNQKGTIRFGAAVEDTDKTKVTKTFDLNVE